MQAIEKMNGLSNVALFFTAAFMMLGLGGCMPQSDKTYHTSLMMPRPVAEMPTKASEEAAWNKVEKLSPASCPAQNVPPLPADAIRMTKCVTNLVERHVIPHAVFPELVHQSREEALMLASQYAKGNLTAAQYHQLSVQRLKSYRTAWAQNAEAQSLKAASNMWQGDKS